ncbi:MAG: hypothetical protein ACE147_19240 [Candidatus Methylomirabilales bacterium]
MTHAAPGDAGNAREVEVNTSRARLLQPLVDARLPFLVGGAYGFYALTGIARFTKDFDVFIHPRDRDRVLEALRAAGYQVEVTFPHWLAKAAAHGDLVLDIIYGAGNGAAPVDDGWFQHAIPGEALGFAVRFCPAEETIWSKAYIMERERFDGADVIHILQARAEQLDWPRLLERFGPHWRVLFVHLTLFGFVFPSERTRIPAWVMRRLQARLESELESRPPAEPLCQGTLISREQYLVDVECRGYLDARQAPRGRLTTEEIAHWTAAIPGRGNGDADRAEREGPRPPGGAG